MERTDEEMIAQFLRRERQEVEDNGFSRRVMRRLPDRRRWGNRLFNVACAAVCVGLFGWLGGFGLLGDMLREALWSAVEHGIATCWYHPAALLTAAGVLLALGIGEACASQD